MRSLRPVLLPVDLAMFARARDVDLLSYRESCENGGDRFGGWAPYRLEGEGRTLGTGRLCPWRCRGIGLDRIGWDGMRRKRFSSEIGTRDLGGHSMRK